MSSSSSSSSAVSSKSEQTAALERLKKQSMLKARSPKLKSTSFQNSATSKNQLLSPEVPNHFKQTRDGPPIVDVCKPYQNPTKTCYFIPGISGRARCLDDEYHVVRDLTKTKSVNSIGSTQSMESSLSNKQTRWRSTDSYPHGKSTASHISAPSSPTSATETVQELGSRNSKNLKNAPITYSLRVVQATAQSNEAFPSPPLTAESRSTRSLLLRSQLASVRSILSDEARWQTCS